MSYFAKPRISQDGYDIKAGGAPDEIWRLRIPQGGRRQVALCCAKGQIVRSNNPNVVQAGDVSESGSKNEDVRMLTVYGRNAGFTILDCVPPGSNSPWGSVQVQVVANMSGGGAGQDTGTLPSVVLIDGIKLGSMPSAAVASFIQAFTSAMAKQLSVDDLNKLEQKLSADLAGFQFGYAKGCILGLVAGLTNLIKAIGELLKLALALSPVALVARASVGAYRFMTEEDYRKEVLNLPARTMEIGNSISNLTQDVIQHPDDYLILSSDVGTQLGQHAGVWMRKDFLGQSAEKIGEDLGNVAGQVLFEIILQLLLAAATAGAGNAARAGTAAAEVAEGAKASTTIMRGSKVSGLVRQLRSTVMRRPGIQRLIKALEALYADERGAVALGGTGSKVVKGTGNVGRILSESRVGGKVVIRSEVGVSPGTRLGTERLLPRGVEVSRPGWQRAHSAGQITGAESGAGIRLAPEELNQQFQRLGIEQFISDLNTQKAADVKLFMTTETEAHEGTLALKSIVYRIEAAKSTARPVIVYEAEITCTRDAVNPRITASANQVRDIEEFLKPIVRQ